MICCSPGHGAHLALVVVRGVVERAQRARPHAAAAARRAARRPAATQTFHCYTITRAVLMKNNILLLAARQL